jgi:hypothetical protein
MEATQAAEEVHIAEEEIGKAKRSRPPKINVSSCCAHKREYEKKGIGLVLMFAPFVIGWKLMITFFFTSSIRKVVWRVLGKALGTSHVPESFWQAIAWFHAYLPNNDKFHIVTLASVCWAIWNVRNRITFDKYILKSPSVITFYSISLLLYWAGGRTFWFS